ncbi:hypothetical protein NYE69_19175 [Paenibacillus sp. FSL R5-0527]|uniref:hypothetical protein n=1 Tax=Paenibacillus sp. FSL R5-0527 TaxID=2975321 RepID=UPI0030F7E614
MGQDTEKNEKTVILLQPGSVCSNELKRSSTSIRPQPQRRDAALQQEQLQGLEPLHQGEMRSLINPKISPELPHFFLIFFVFFFPLFGNPYYSPNPCLPELKG